MSFLFNDQICDIIMRLTGVDVLCEVLPRVSRGSTTTVPGHMYSGTTPTRPPLQWLLMLWKHKFGYGLVPNPKAVDLVKIIMGGAVGNQTPLPADDADAAALLSALEKDEAEEEAAVAAKEKEQKNDPKKKKKTRSLRKVLGV